MEKNVFASMETKREVRSRVPVEPTSVNLVQKLSQSCPLVCLLGDSRSQQSVITIAAKI